MDRQTLRKLQKFRAEAIPANAIRNQGAEGVLEAIHTHLARLRLATLAVKDRRSFDRRLRVATDRLVKRLEVKCSIEDRWGVARKALNLFLRDCTYDHHLRAHFRLGKIEPWLEVPLDSFVAHALRGTRSGRNLPRWDSLIELKAEVSHKYQEVAQTIADRKRIARVHLDLRYWTEGRERRKRAFAGGVKK